MNCSNCGFGLGARLTACRSDDGAHIAHCPHYPYRGGRPGGPEAALARKRTRAELDSAHSEDKAVDCETYVHLSPVSRVRVREGAYPTLQLDDTEGHAFSINGTSGQLRDIANAITEYLAEKGKAEIAAMPTNEYLDQVG